MRRYTINVTTAANGSVTAYSPARISGKIHQIEYVKGNFDNGSTITVTGNATGVPIWAETGVNASAVRAPRQATHTGVGAAALYASGGVAVLDKIAIANDQIKIVIASGGNAKTGTFHILVD